MKQIKYLLIFLLCLSINVFALSSDYEDIVSPLAGIEVDSTKLNIYQFKGDGCPHCADEEKTLERLKEKYKPLIEVHYFEVWHDKENEDLLYRVQESFNMPKRQSVPFTVIGKERFSGYSESLDSVLEDTIKYYLSDEKIVKEEIKNTKNLPLLGKVNAKEVSLITVAIILGVIDGFNPCAMWILLLLINMCISIKDKKKMRQVGLVFILVSGLMYFVSMLGLSFVINMVSIKFIRLIIGVLAVAFGIYNLAEYVKTRKDDGCAVTSREEKKEVITKVKDILSRKTTLLLILGTASLAVSVNLIELTCSLGFPTIYLEILAINKVNLITKIIYLLIYVFFYMFDDFVVLFYSLKAFETKAISTKYNKYVKLVGGILMILMGLLLVFKPEWVMLNF